MAESVNWKRDLELQIQVLTAILTVFFRVKQISVENQFSIELGNYVLLGKIHTQSYKAL